MIRVGRRAGLVLSVVLLSRCARHSSIAPIDVATARFADASVTVTSTDGGAEPHAHAVATIAPAFVVIVADAPGRLDPSDRLRVSDGAGGTVLPGDPDPTVRNAPVQTPVFAGDRIETDDASLTLRDPHQREISLGSHARAVIPSFGGSDIVLSRGEARIELAANNREPFVLDTPAIRARVVHGTLRCLVADEGHTVCAAIDAPVEIWPSPPAPASTLGARVITRAHARPGHPISLDVHVQELQAPARPLVRVILAPGHSVVFGPDGAVSTDRPGALTDAAWHSWRTRVESRLSDASGHLYPIAQIARAATGDLADARALIARHDAERTGSSTPGTAGLQGGIAGALTTIAADDADRDTTEFLLSAALGRAEARADRARTLALRGGDVTALVPVAHLAEVEESARAVVLPTASMLDSDERPHVP